MLVFECIAGVDNISVSSHISFKAFNQGVDESLDLHTLFLMQSL